MLCGQESVCVAADRAVTGPLACMWPSFRATATWSPTFFKRMQIIHRPNLLCLPFSKSCGVSERRREDGNRDKGIGESGCAKQHVADLIGLFPHFLVSLCLTQHNPCRYFHGGRCFSIFLYDPGIQHSHRLTTIHPQVPSQRKPCISPKCPIQPLTTLSAFQRLCFSLCASLPVLPSLCLSPSLPRTHSTHIPYAPPRRHFARSMPGNIHRKYTMRSQRVTRMMSKSRVIEFIRDMRTKILSPSNTTNDKKTAAMFL